MSSRIHRSVAVLVILFFNVTRPCAARSPEPYAQFKVAFNTNNANGLQELAASLAADRLAANRHLGILAQAAAHFRSDEMAACQTALDSLDQVVGPENVLLLGLSAKFKAMVASWYGESDRAISYAAAGLELFAASTFPEERVDLLVVRAEALRALEHPALSMEALREAQRLSEHQGYARGVCLVRINLGNLKFDQGRYDEALQEYRLSLDCATANGFDMIAQNSINNVGSAAVMMEEYDVAVHLYDSLLAALGDRSPELRARLHAQTGFVATMREDHAAALIHYRRALDLQEGLRNRLGVAKTHQHMAASLWALGRRNEAIELMNKVLQETIALHRPELEREVRSELAWWYEELGSLREAMLHKDADMRLSDSLNNARFNDRLARSEVLFGTERKERRIVEQVQALAIAKAEDQRKAMQRNVSIGIGLVLLLVALLLWRGLRTRQRLAQKERELHSEQVDQLLSAQELSSVHAMLDGQEKERERMGKDLHDRLGSMLSSIKVNMSAMEDRMAQMRTDQQYQKVDKLLDEAVSELRRISHDMAAGTLSRFGLEKALADLRDTVHISGRLSVELKSFGLEQRLERSVEIAVYRMVQELVSNVLKHAKAHELSIAVTRSPGRLSLMVVDDGIGFDTSRPAEGMGLHNVRSRATALGGSMQVDSAIGAGTTVSVECPIIE